MKLHPVEVGCRAYAASSTSRMLWEIGVRGQAYRRAIKYVAEMEERSSYGAKISRPVRSSPTQETWALSVYCSILSCMLGKKMLHLPVWLRGRNYDAVPGKM